MKNRVYRNLRTKTWSVQVAGRVVEHPDTLMLENCKFVVQAGGRARVLRERKKFVHAFIDGDRVDLRRPLLIPYDLLDITYNPYKFGYFYIKETEQPIYTARLVLMLANGKVYAKL